MSHAITYWARERRSLCFHLQPEFDTPADGFWACVSFKRDAKEHCHWVPRLSLFAKTVDKDGV